MTDLSTVEKSRCWKRFLDFIFQPSTERLEASEIEVSGRLELDPLLKSSELSRLGHRYRGSALPPAAH